MQPTITDDVIKELGIEVLTPEEQQDFVTSFYLAIRAKFSLIIAERLNDEQLEAFDAVIDKGDEDATEAWLKQNLPDYDELYLQIVDEVKTETREMIDSVSGK